MTGVAGVVYPGVCRVAYTQGCSRVHIPRVVERHIPGLSLLTLREYPGYLS